MSPEKRLIIDTVVASLDTEPEQWRFSEYRAEHPNGVSIWIANGNYGLEIKAPGFSVGGVTLASTFLGWATPWRRRVRAAVERAAFIQLPRQIKGGAA